MSREETTPAELKRFAGKWKPVTDNIKDELRLWLPSLWSSEDQIKPLPQILKETKELFPEQVDIEIPKEPAFTRLIKTVLEELRHTHEIELVPTSYRRIACLRPAYKLGVNASRKTGYQLDPALQTIVDKYEGMGIGMKVSLSQSTFDKILTLDGIFVPKESRKQGLGTAFMEELVAAADRGGFTIFLTPSTDFGGSSVSRLRTFYGRFGFKRNMGRNKDYRSWNAMVRQPQKPKKASTENTRFVVAVAKAAGVVMAEGKLILYHGTRLWSQISHSDTWGRGTLFMPSRAAAVPVARDSKIAGAPEVIAALVDPSMVTVGGTKERPYFIASTRIPIQLADAYIIPDAPGTHLAGARDPYDREYGPEGPYPEDRQEPCVENEGKEDPLSVGAQGATAALKTYVIQQDEDGYFIDVNPKLQLRPYKIPKWRQNYFVPGHDVIVKSSPAGECFRTIVHPVYRSIDDTWKIQGCEKSKSVPTPSTPAVKPPTKKELKERTKGTALPFNAAGETFYHGRSNDRPYNGDYIFLTPNRDYALGYSRGPNGLHAFRLRIPDAEIFSMKRQDDRVRLESALDPQTWSSIVESTPVGEELDWANLGLICNDEWELPEELLAALGYKGTYLKERTGIESIYLFNQSDAEEIQIPAATKSASTPSIGFNVNDSEMPWTDMILQGKKTIETRDNDSLRPYVGERVGIIRTGKGTATLVGYCTIGEPKVYRTNEEFRADNSKHQIPAGPEWDLQPGAVKYGYPLSDVETTDPKQVNSRGIVFSHLAHIYDGYCPICGARGCRGECMSGHGSNHKRASVATYYHVTPHTRSASIKREGLVIGKRRQWTNQRGETIGAKDRIYLFTDLDSAIQFGFRLQWGTKKPVDIIRVEADLPDIEKDPHVESQMHGTWVMTSTPIPPDKIKEIFPLTPELINDYIARDHAKYSGSKVAAPDDFVSFRTWFKAAGGWKYIDNIWGSDWREYYRAQAIEEADGDDEAVDDIERQLIETDLERAYEDWCYKYSYLMKFPLTLYRAISLDGPSSLVTTGIGVYWTDSESHAQAHWGSRGTVYVVVAEVEADAVDWEGTIHANTDPSLGEDEQEVRLKEGAHVRLLGYYKKTHSGVRSPMVPLDAEAVA